MKTRHSVSKHGRRTFAALAALCLLPLGPLSADEPGLVSIDFCADQYLLALADKSEIQAVSFEAPLARSYHRKRADGLPTVTGSLEELLMMRPKTVLRTWRGGAKAGEILGRANITSFQPPFAYSLESNFDTYLAVGAEIGRLPEAEALVADQKRRLGALRDKPKSSLKAVYMTPSGFTAGTGTFVDSIIKLAGFSTVAEDAGIRSWAPLPLEKMVLSPPDFIVASFFGDEDVLVSYWSSGRHGVNARMMANLPTIHIPSDYLSCSGAFSVDAAEYIRTEATRLGLISTEGKAE